MKPQTIYGIHDLAGAEFLSAHSRADRRPGWITHPVAIGLDGGQGMETDYSGAANQGVDVIVRLNHGYGDAGTIPIPQDYERFAESCARYVARTRGCSRWIIGNEPNHRNERVDDIPITPPNYARCFALCRSAIRSIPGHEIDQVIPAAVAPWNVESGDWLSYFKLMMDLIGWHSMDGIAIHAYTHGSDPALVASDEQRHGWRWHFRVYRDLLDLVPKAVKHLPVYITETNQGDGPWRNENNGWVQAVYDEINRWNTLAAPLAERPRIHCACLYRWQNYDRWAICNKPGVLDDLSQAMQGGVTATRSLPSYEPPKTYTVHLPAVTVQPTPKDGVFDWDTRLDERGAKLVRTDYEGPHWALISGEWLDEQQSGGRHHIFVDVLDEAGHRMAGVGVKFAWDGGVVTRFTETKPGESYAVDFPMHAVAPAYSVEITGESDRVTGLGMGSIEQPHYAIHTSYRFVFQRRDGGAERPDDGEKDMKDRDADVLDPFVLQAILRVESGGEGFENGRLKIRFEPHVFKRLLGNDALFDANFEIAERESWKRPQYLRMPGGVKSPIHTSQATEYAALERAKSINAQAAYESLGMGVGQTMGENHARLGYPSAETMFRDYDRSLNAQIIGVINYILTDDALVDAVYMRDWAEIASRYNGPGWVDVYAPRLANAYRELIA